MDILAGLNPAQREAVLAPGGPLLIVAGPGSGKTRVIAHRIAYLIQARRVPPFRILAVTFTNKAAREMKARVYQLLGQAGEEVTLGTFHAICARLLRREATSLGIASNFAIYDDEDQLSLLKRALEDLDLDPKRNPPGAIQAKISEAKAQLLAPEAWLAQAGSYFDEVAGRVYGRYQALLAEAHALDFDDLLMKAVLLFQGHPEVLEKYQGRYLHLLIDEFQDTNLAQYALARLLAGQHRDICVVGDPDQSIYSWRFADPRHILSFERDYPEARVVFLEQNYRSTKAILQAAASVIAGNVERKPLKLWTENEAGDLLVVHEAYNESEEARFVLQQIEALRAQGFRLADCAVMYRTNAQSRALEEELLRYGIPYKLVGGLRFYERREVKDILAYLRLVHNPYDSVSLLRIINVPGRGIGQRTLEEVSRFAQARGLPLYAALQAVVGEAEGRPALASRSLQALSAFLGLANRLMAQARELDLVSLVDRVLDETGYRAHLLEGEEGEERWENILELRGVAQEFRDLEPQEGLAAFLEQMALVSDVDSLDEQVEGVTLITLHQAKGLEFPVVFIVGMEEGLLPHRRSLDDPAQMQEERRLCYVGMTRAKKRLYLVRAFRRSLLGASAPTLPSRFLGDVPASLIGMPTLPEPSSRPRPEGPEPARTSPLPPVRFRAGDHVLHSKFGEGIVISLVPARDDYEVTVAFKGEAGLKKLLLAFAHLEPA